MNVTPDPKGLLGSILTAPERAAMVPVEQIPGLLGHLASLEATLKLRLFTASQTNGPPESHDGDRLLTPEEASRILGASVRWLYRHSKQLPFARRLSRKALRFSEAGLRRWLAAKRT